MPKIFIQPCSDKRAQINFENTIKNGVSLLSISQFLNENDRKKLEMLYPDGTIYIWGLKAGKGRNIKLWEKINQDNIIFFYANKKVFANARITYKMQNKNLANHLWGKQISDIEQEPWEFLYFVNNINYHKIDQKDINNILSYNPNFNVQGFHEIDNEKSEEILSNLDLDLFFNNEFTSEDFENLKILSNTSLDKDIKAKSRVEQRLLRKFLFKNQTCFCSICKREFPVNLLVAAHIKKRALCSNDERLDIKNIVFPLCKLGCDELYEKGYIYIDNSGQVKSNKLNSTTVDTDIYISKIENNICEKFNNDTMKYFNFHKNYFLNIF